VILLQRSNFIRKLLILLLLLDHVLLILGDDVALHFLDLFLQFNDLSMQELDLFILLINSSLHTQLFSILGLNLFLQGCTLLYQFIITSTVILNLTF
jgi:hypothetical protein